MRNPEYQFADTNAETLVARLVSDYEKSTGTAVQPASPERQIIQWVASILVHERVLMNVIGNQNIPSRAEGENLDALAQLLKLQERPRAKAAVCTQRFHISEAQQSAVLVPQGTRVTCSGGLIWETAEDVYINIGDTYADTQLRCQTPGAVGNGYAAGQLDTLIDLYDYTITIPPDDLAGTNISEAALVDADGVLCAIRNMLPKGKDAGVSFTFTFDDEF